MNDYLISFDSSGQPFIAHAWGRRQNTKYIARISDGKGGFRYFYSQREWDAYRNRDIRKREKQADRETNYNKVSAKQYLTGGKEKNSFNYAKAQNRKAQDELKSSTRAYTQSVKDQQKAYSTLRDARANGKPWNISKAEKALSEAKKQTSQASQRASAARLTAKETSRRYEKFEKAYESTSLPGATHRLVRIGREKVKNLVNTVGNTPVAYIKKSR